MTPKLRRDRLFKDSRPKVRRLEVMDGEQYGKDMGILWAAYQAGGFETLKRDMSQEEFLSVIQPILDGNIWMIEDRCKAFSSGVGPVCIAMSIPDGLGVLVSGDKFPWATTRNVLRCAVAFIWMLIHSSKVGVIFTKQPRKMKNACSHLKEYGVLHYIGKVGEDVFLYAVRGRGSD